ncbi:MAG: DNA polymerase I [Myxococcota bacterium]
MATPAVPPDLPQTELPPRGDPNTLYVIDVSSFVFRAYHALPPLSSSRGEPTHAVRGFTSMLLKLLEERDPQWVAAALEGEGSFRKELYPEYKANRDAPPEDLGQQVLRVHEVLDAFGIPRLRHPRYEADDVIATLVRLARERGLSVVIVSADKDLLQLVGPDVCMLDTMRDRIFGVAETWAKFGVAPEQVRDLLALMGDSSDNVPGVPSVGQKTAAKLLAAHGSMAGVYEALDSLKGRVKTKLDEHRDQAELSRDLVTLKDDADVGLADAQVGEGDPAALRALFTELEFTRLLAQLDPQAAPSEGTVEVLTSLEELRALAAEARDHGQLAIVSYLTDPDPLRGELVGVGLSFAEGRGAYLPLAHRTLGAPEMVPMDDALGVLRPLLENSLLPKLSPDLKREDLIWRRRGIELRGYGFDVALASYLLDPGRHGHGMVEVARAELDAELPLLERLVHPKRGVRLQPDEVDVPSLGDLAAKHADFVVRLTNLLRPRMEHGDFVRLFRELELPLAAVLADMERVGVRVDTEKLGAMSAAASEELAALEARCHTLAGHAFNVGSPRQLETILFDELGLPVVKRTKTGRSTDAQVLEELAAQHALPEAILAHRTLSKLQGTYLDALPAAVLPETGRVHTRYNQAVAATGRLSSSDPNLQNIPIRTNYGRRIREAFVPAPGLLLLAADYSQIELRVLAHLSGDPELVDAYRTGEDVHRRTASALFDVAPGDVDYTQRNQAKTVNFAVIYGQTQFALARNLKIERSEAKRYIDAFFARYAGVQRFMETVVEEAKRTGYVTTLLGRRRGLNDIRSRNRNLRAGAERIARNTPIQGTAADIIKIAMVRVQDRLRREGMATRMILTVHDELLFEVPEGERAEAEVLIKETMEGALTLDVPLEVDVGFGTNWGAAH